MLRMTFTSLRWSIVFARRWRSGTSTASFLDAQGSAFDHFTLQAILRCIGLLWCHHFNEAEPSRFTGVRIAHDIALLHISVFLKHAGHFFLAESRMNAGYKEVCPGITGGFILLGTSILWDSTARIVCEIDVDSTDQLTNRP